MKFYHSIIGITEIQVPEGSTAVIVMQMQPTESSEPVSVTIIEEKTEVKEKIVEKKKMKKKMKEPKLSFAESVELPVMEESSPREFHPSESSQMKPISVFTPKTVSESSFSPILEKEGPVQKIEGSTAKVKKHITIRTPAEYRAEPTLERTEPMKTTEATSARKSIQMTKSLITETTEIGAQQVTESVPSKVPEKGRRRSSFTPQQTSVKSEDVALEIGSGTQKVPTESALPRRGSFKTKSLSLVESKQILEASSLTVVSKTDSVKVTSQTVPHHLIETGSTQALESSQDAEILASEKPRMSITFNPGFAMSSDLKIPIEEAQPFKPAECQKGDIIKMISPLEIPECSSTVQMEKEDLLRVDVPTEMAISSHHITFKAVPLSEPVPVSEREEMSSTERPTGTGRRSSLTPQQTSVKSRDVVMEAEDGTISTPSKQTVKTRKPSIPSQTLPSRIGEVLLEKEGTVEKPTCITTDVQRVTIPKQTPERTGEVVLETNQSAIATPAKQMVKSRRSSLKDHSLPSESKEVTLEKEQALQEASKQLVKTRKSSLTGQSLPFESSAVTLEKEGRISQVKETKGLVIAADMTAQQLQETSFMKSLEKSTKDETMAAQVPHGTVYFNPSAAMTSTLILPVGAKRSDQAI